MYLCGDAQGDSTKMIQIKCVEHNTYIDPRAIYIDTLQLGTSIKHFFYLDSGDIVEGTEEPETLEIFAGGMQEC